MDKKILEKIKADLLERKKQVEDDLKNITEGGIEHKPKYPDIGDKQEENAMEISEYTTNIATEKVLESTLRDVDGALKRIEEGTYGVCKYCGKEIGEKRMLARPVASACVECKSNLQKQA